MSLATSCLLPNHYLPWYFFHSDALAFFALFAWLLSVQLEPGSGRVVPRVVLSVLLAIAIPWAQWAVGLLGFAGEAWVATLYLAGLAGSLYVGFQWARLPSTNEIALKTVVAATLAAGLISVGLSLFQWLRLEDLLGIFIANLGDTARPFANLAQPNLLATLTVMSLVALAWFYQSRLVHGWVFAVVALFLSVGLCLTQSRAGYLSAAAIAGCWFAKQGAVPASRIKRWWPAAWLLCIPLIAAALHGMSAAFEFADDRGVPLVDNNGRWLMWKQIAEGIREAPWLGYGWEHTAAAQMAGAPAHPGNLATAYAHNIGLDALAWLGIPLGLAVSVAGALWLLTRAARARGEPAVFALTMALPVLVHSLFEFPFAYAVFLVPAGIMLGVVEGSREQTLTRRNWSRVAWVFILGWGAIGAEVAREYAPAEDDFRFLRFEAVRLGKTPEGHTRPKFILLSQMEALLEVGRITPEPGMSMEQIERVRSVSVKYPWAPPAVLYAAVLEANGFHQAAARQMDVIRGMYGNRYFVDASARLDDLRAEWRVRANSPRPQ